MVVIDQFIINNKEQTQCINEIKLCQLLIYTLSSTIIPYPIALVRKKLRSIIALSVIISYKSQS